MEKKRAYLGVGPRADRKAVETLVQYLESANTELFVAQRDVEQWGAPANQTAAERMKSRLSALASAAYYIGEFSDSSPLIYFEAGYAHAAGKPVVGIHRSGTVVGEELETICSFVIEYEDPQDLMQKMMIGEKFQLFDE